MKLKALPLFVLTIVLLSCNGNKSGVPVIGFVDALEDATLAKARVGFTDALKKNGFTDKQNIKINYQNAQGDPNTLALIIDQCFSQKVDLIATCTTAATIAAAQKIKTIPIFKMVAPTARLMGLTDTAGNGPANVFGVEEDLAYIDTSFAIIPQMVKAKHGKLVIGMIYSQAQSQSVDAMTRIKTLADKMGVTLYATPVNSSADAQLVTRSLLNKGIDVFFANPDDAVFASFETIYKSCEEKGVPIFTSEAGLVQRGAVAAFGADIYQWGYQAGEQAAQYLKTHKTEGLKPEMVKVRKRVYNPLSAKKYNIAVPSNFEAVK